MPHYLIRHAHAVSDEEDPLRPLSARGREQVSRICAELREGPPFRPAEIWHSSLVRSRETAELLVSGLGIAVKLLQKEGLEPEDDPRAAARVFEAQARDIAVVGHEPHLGILAALMTAGGGRVQARAFPKAGVMALRREGPRWKAEWIAGAP